MTVSESAFFVGLTDDSIGKSLNLTFNVSVNYVQIYYST